MKTTIMIALAAVVAASLSFTAPAKAVQYGVALGTIEHVSTQNVRIKVWRTKQDMSFLLVPKFKNVFSKDGKTTYEMTQIKPGMDVDIHWSQSLGLRHADKIYVLNSHGHVLKAVKG